MAKSKEISAGLLMWDIEDGVPKVLLCHSGGPFFVNPIKNPRAWGIAKGRTENEENLLQTAIREFEEETSIKTKPPYISLGHVTYNSGKIVHAFAFRNSYDGIIKSNNFSIEWPPRSGKTQEFPEIDKAEMFTISDARKIIMPSQEPFLDSFELNVLKTLK